MRVGSILQKVGDYWYGGEMGEYVIICSYDAAKNLYYYRYESVWDDECLHSISGPWDIVGLSKNFVLVRE